MTLPPVQHFSHHRPRIEARPAHPAKVADHGFSRILAMLDRSERSPGDAPLPSQDEEADGRDQALIFNQDGYFGSAGSAEFGADGSPAESDTAIPAGPIGAGGPSDELPESPIAGMEVPPTMSESRAFSAPQTLPATDRRDRGSGAKAGFVRPSLLAGKQTRAGLKDPALSIAAEARKPDPSEAEKIDPAGPARVRTLRDPSGAGSPLNLRVSLVPSGDSLDVGVRLGRLSARQRAELRLEIARLLSRYGIHVGEVLLNGTVEPSRRF